MNAADIKIIVDEIERLERHLFTLPERIYPTDNPGEWDLNPERKFIRHKIANYKQAIGESNINVNVTGSDISDPCSFGGGL